MPFSRRPHQRGLPAPRFFPVDIRTACSEHVHRIDTPAARRGHQCRFAFGQGRVRIRSRFQQRLDHRRVSIRRCQIQRSNAIPIRGIDVGARANEHLRRFHIIGSSRPVERCCPIGFRGIHIRTLLEQRADRGSIGCLYRVDQIACDE